MRSATGAGRVMYTAWEAASSSTVDRARRDMARWLSGGISRSSVATRYQLGLSRQAGRVIVPAAALVPHGGCESAMNAATSAGRSAPKDAWNLVGSWKMKPSRGGNPGIWGVWEGNLPMSVLTDSCL